AHAKKRPCFRHESNAVPGLTTKLLNQTADTIFVAFPGVEKAYKHPERVVFAGTPVRAGFSAMTQEEAKESLGLSGKKLVVSFWGSLGARICNQCSAEAIALNEANPQYVQIHATGGGNAGYQSFLQLLGDRGIDKEGCRVSDIRPYIDNMPVVMRAADLVLCRSGASTLGELTAIGKPSVLIPSPYVTDNHQEKNALRLQEGGGAVMLKETDCTGQLLHETVSKLLSDETKLADMSRAVAALGVPDSAERIADYIRTRLREVPV
ncbi:MAG: UDP-N-acetylglucosamine--N-acetylmuramyl-(pentapeptide) pyrophosphoryl-undecaprenol N-acetylglucosamine transferase, partial [Oscillospiraceae bacterium]|nr:UDP-N-acetylglucosamine--N-acetylmuramyl-(pentapeptide) pyrophosphoryl-undecaprenol N-acetylglucosamine transferase [Oscillospiraceae bacterium]